MNALLRLKFAFKMALNRPWLYLFSLAGLSILFTILFFFILFMNLTKTVFHDYYPKFGEPYWIVPEGLTRIDTELTLNRSVYEDLTENEDVQGMWGYNQAYLTFNLPDGEESYALTYAGMELKEGRAPPYIYEKISRLNKQEVFLSERLARRINLAKGDKIVIDDITFTLIDTIPYDPALFAPMYMRMDDFSEIIGVDTISFATVKVDRLSSQLVSDLGQLDLSIVKTIDATNDLLHYYFITQAATAIWGLIFLSIIGLFIVFFLYFFLHFSGNNLYLTFLLRSGVGSVSLLERSFDNYMFLLIPSFTAGIIGSQIMNQILIPKFFYITVYPLRLLIIWGGCVSVLLFMVVIGLQWLVPRIKYD